jgi:MFS family permease
LILYLETVKLCSPVISATIFLAFSGAVTPVSGMTGAYIAKMGSYKWSVICGWLINTFGLGALMILGSQSYTAGIVFLLTLVGCGQGMLFIAHQVATQASCPAKDVAYASAMFSFCRSLGFCLGIALGGTVFQNFFRHQLQSNGLPTIVASNAEGFATSLRSMADLDTQALFVAAYSAAFHNLYATMAGISGLGLFLSLLIEEHDLNVKHDSTHKLRSREMLGRAGNDTREKQALAGQPTQPTEV